MMKVKIAAALLVGLFAASAMAQETAPAPPQEISIKLPAATWNIVLQALSELPLKVAAPIVQTIQEQAKPQFVPPASAPEKPKK